MNYRTPAPSVQQQPVLSAASRLRSASSDSERIGLGIALFHPGRRVIQRLVSLGGDVAAEPPLGPGQCPRSRALPLLGGGAALPGGVACSCAPEETKLASSIGAGIVTGVPSQGVPCAVSRGRARSAVQEQT